MGRPLSIFRRDAPGIAEVPRTGVEGPQPAPERSLNHSRLGAWGRPRPGPCPARTRATCQGKQGSLKSSRNGVWSVRMLWCLTGRLTRTGRAAG